MAFVYRLLAIGVVMTSQWAVGAVRPRWSTTTLTDFSPMWELAQVQGYTLEWPAAEMLVSQLALTVAPSRRAPKALIAAISGGHPRPSMRQYPEGTQGPHCSNIRRAPKALNAAISGGHFLSVFLSACSRPLISYPVLLQ